MTTDKDTVNVLGVRADGSAEVIGTAPMPPRMKARELVTEMFGAFQDDDGSEADLAMACCESLLVYLGTTQFTVTPKKPAPLSDERLIQCIRSAAAGSVPMGLLRDRGPYEVTEPTPFARSLAAAIQAATGAAA